MDALVITRAERDRYQCRASDNCKDFSYAKRSEWVIVIGAIVIQAIVSEPDAASHAFDASTPKQRVANQSQRGPAAFALRTITGVESEPVS